MGWFKKRKRIVVLGARPYPDLFKRFGSVELGTDTLFNEPSKIDMVVLSGGADVHPYFYRGKDRYKLCFTSIKRDRFEKSVFEHCKLHNVKITGICRGLQFINVMAGGFMFQHIEDHSLNYMHEVYYPFSGEMIPTNSYHHQLVGLAKEAIPIAWACPKRSSVYVWQNGQVTKTIGQEEIEAAIFPKLRAMGVQYHPEWMSHRSFGRIHYEAMFKDFLELSITKFTEKYGRNSNNDCRTDGKARRASS